MPDAGRVWAALSEAHAQSGLVPFLLSGIAGGTERPWDSQEFRDPEDVTGLDHLDAAELLREDEFGGTGLHDVPGITASLLNSPIWTFWWD